MFIHASFLAKKPQYHISSLQYCNAQPFLSLKEIPVPVHLPCYATAIKYRDLYVTCSTLSLLSCMQQQTLFSAQLPVSQSENITPADYYRKYLGTGIHAAESVLLSSTADFFNALLHSLIKKIFSAPIRKESGSVFHNRVVKLNISVFSA